MSRYTNTKHDIEIRGHVSVTAGRTYTAVHIHVETTADFEDAVEQLADLDPDVQSKEETADIFTNPHAVARAYLDDYKVVVHGPHHEA